MRCSKINLKLNAYLDQETDHQMTQIISTHLLTCKKCQQELFSLKQINQSLDADFNLIPDHGIIQDLIRQSRFISPKKTLINSYRMKNAVLTLFALISGAYFSISYFDQANQSAEFTSQYESQSLYSYVYEVEK